jgi:hypothetical protein
MAGINLQLEPDILEPLIRQVVRETIAACDAERSKLDGKLAYSEPEAARLLGLEPHVLRDERLRGRIGASAIVGRRIRYTRQDLMDYLLGRRWEKR